MYFAYVLRSLSCNRLYVGSTSQLQVRVSQHNEGISSPTKHWRPWELVHSEEFKTRAEAMRRERFWKTGRGREELKLLLARRAHQTQR
ncbi:MAG: GIY-YIG nuclease family protein [Acidobacteria bacterium]|nr:GIY-YIG nuclease family protein [Acidobacteriota bacterium]